MSSDFCIKCDKELSVYCGPCMDEARAEVERLTKMLDVCSSVHGHNVKLHEERKQLREALRTVAERQRDADRKAFAAWLREVHATGFPHETPEVLAGAVDAEEVTLPLVTEGEP